MKWPQSRINEIVMKHYTEELKACDRYGKMMTEGMVTYYWNLEENKKVAAIRARGYYRKMKSNPARYAQHRASQRERMRRRLQSRPDLKVRKNLSTRLCIALKGKKNWRSVIEYIGCSVDYLSAYLEARFSKGMTWDNYGSYWQVDHIVPCAAFDHSDEEQVKKCWHFSNLQPLTSSENNSKNALVRPCQPELQVGA